MADYKKVIKYTLFPPLWLIIVLTFISTASLIYVFVKGLEESPISYAIYVLSFYTLSILCIFFYKTMPGYYKKMKAKIYGNRYANRYLTDAVYKTHISLYVSLPIRLLLPYPIFKTLLFLYKLYLFPSFNKS